MEIKIAKQLLDIRDEYTCETLKKAYYKKCLQYHPDKNKDGAEMFKLCNEAYETLQIHIQDNDTMPTKNNENVSNKSYNEIFQEYLIMMKQKYNLNDTVIKDVFLKIIKSCSTISLQLFEDLDESTMMELYELLIKWKHIFHIKPEILDSIKEMIHTKNQAADIYTLEPSLEDLFQHNVYKLVVNNNNYYAPLWHHELYFKNNITVHINPRIDSQHVEIDTNNNIIVYKKFVIQNILHAEILYIELANKVFNIPVNELRIKPIQEYRFRNSGIPKINTKNMFDDSELSDVIVYIILKHGFE